ncbi:Rho termination factor N-terminal domain-containing protein [Cellulophaga baltica]|uniref:Rho termination factor N-terminal domain-containing protein n=1 Tax=Cellulophaga baltica TaxID=76594 RepID=UPI00040DA3B8|nr:Rho termination factor N-terminal domain-containing protein [Cellulophaga baltica]
MENIKTFFIHIASDSLAHYLVRGIFCPSRFLNNRNKDIQDQFESFLLLSDKKWNTNYDCSIEIVLVEEDIAGLIQINDNFSVLGNCLPISRLRKIHFADKKKAENVIWNINQGAAFVPEWAISYEYKAKEETAHIDGKHNFPETYSEKKIKVNIERYDRLLGGFAFMKNGLLNSEFKNLDTTINYLSAVAYFNSHIANDLKKEEILVNTNLQNIFSKKNDILKYLAKPILIDDVNEFGKKEKQIVQKQFNAIKFESLNPTSSTYKLAILHTYGKGKVKSDNDLVSGLLSNISSDLVEELALIYGLYSGYTALRNSYSNINSKIDVKFKLDSKLEFCLIESLFNYAFKDHKISGEIDFLENSKQKDKEVKSNKAFNYINLLGDAYSYEKNVKVSIEKDSLTSMLLETIKTWCKNNNAQCDEEKLVLKFGKSIIPEIRTTITPIKKVTTTDISSEQITKGDNRKMEEKSQQKAAPLKSYEKEIKNKTNQVNVPTQFKIEGFEEVKRIAADQSDITFAKLEKYSLIELKDLCKEKGYKGYSKFKKQDLIKFILSQ